MKTHLFALALVFALGAAHAQKPADATAPPQLWQGDGERIVKWMDAAGMPDSDLVHLGNLAIELEQSPLSNLAETLKAQPAHSGDASTALTWICLHIDGKDADARLWLTSDEMGGGKIDGATMMRLPAASAPAPGCPALPAQYAAIRLPGDLKLGAPEAELRAKLGKPSFDKNGIAAFSRSYDLGVPASKGGPCQLSTTAWFRFEAGAATVLQLSHIGAC